MAHRTDDKWRAAGANIPEVWHRRRRFLTAAADFRPELLEEFRSLGPLARELSAALGGNSAPHSWHDVTVRATFEQVGERFGSSAPQSERAPATRFRDQLQAWAARWRLNAIPDDQEDDWILEAATSTLTNPVYRDEPPLTVPTFSWSRVVPGPSVDERLAMFVDFDALDPQHHDAAHRGAMRHLSGRGFRFDVEPWYGDVSSKAWLDQALGRIEDVLKRHIEHQRAKIEELGLDRVPATRSSSSREGGTPIVGGVDYVDLCARWQVSGEAWDAFLNREGLKDKTVHRVRDGMLEQLSFVGIEPRAGMRTV